MSEFELLKPEIQEYVEKYAFKHKVTKEQALEHLVVKIFKEYKEKK